MEEVDPVEQLKERVNTLEAKVAHLERETDTSYEEEQFTRRVESLFPSDAEIETSDNQIGGYHAFVGNISVDVLNAAIEKIEFRDQYDYQWAMTETGEGIGIEVWTGHY